MYQSDIFEYLEKKRDNTLLVCSNDKEAISTRDVALLLGYKTFVLPDIRVSIGDDLRSYREEIREIFCVLKKYHATDEKKILITPVRTALLPSPRSKYFNTVELEFGEELDIDGLKSKLHDWGYHFVDIATNNGEVSFRGDIIDIYPSCSNYPYRISLFDNEIESIHIYDEGTQKRSPDELENMEIGPSFLSLSTQESAELKERVEYSSYDSFVKDIDSLGLWSLGELGCYLMQVMQSVAVGNILTELEELDEISEGREFYKDFVAPEVIPRATIYRDISPADIGTFIEAHSDKEIVVLAKNESVVRASSLLFEKEVEYLYLDAIVNIMSNDKLYLSLNKASKTKRVKRAKIILDQLNVGEYVVHEQHGVGVFKSIEKRDVLGAVSEFVVIGYQNEDTLLIPVANMETIDRYVADSGTLPSIDRLGKASFKRLKAKVREKLFAIASEIINLSAKRHMKKGITISYDTEEYALFRADAGFTHTQDQNRAIDEMLSDLSSGQMMDRLLSADVGFGKTEVAMNGMYVSAKGGYQAMMIAPTTLLCSQHYRSLVDRLVKYDISVAKLDRFSSTKEKKDTLAGLEDGSIDVVVGTHALLKAKFKNLALVIIDEEHKFGVKQKEALKELAIDMHLLSMSATPIPRSLNMAMSKIKTFSEILTPPVDRVGVRTFVKEYDESILKEAILREIRRGGQIFYVFNSIAKIEQKKKILQELIPKLRITVLHSKIMDKESEEEMQKFEKGEYDVMLSTSIVESGIHMPSANTMIVDGADRFGIADLHQLRGRVGRGGKIGYCYFIVPDRDSLTDTAKRRLLALEAHSDLGSGAVLAFHDLEIRGGGNIIGEAQSGHIKQIGYSLYLKMLEDAIMELSGHDKDLSESIEIKLNIDAYLNEDLIQEDRLRLELYRRLSQCQVISDVYDIESEISDRFGRVDKITRQFIDMMAIKVLAKDKSISRISSYDNKIFIEYMGSKNDRTILNSPSKDDDDIIRTALEYFTKLTRIK